MATIKKSGGWNSSYGGREFKGSGGKVNMLGTSKGKGQAKGSMPAGGGAKCGQSFYLGKGAGKGIPKKGGSGKGSGWAAKHD